MSEARRPPAAASKTATEPKPHEALATDQNVTLHLIRHFEERFRKERNPVFAWEAIREALSARLELPPWTIDYLRIVARRIGALTGHTPKKREVARQVAGALGFRTASRGKFNPFTSAYAQSAVHERMVASDVFDSLQENLDDNRRGVAATHDLRSIYSTAAERHAKRCSFCKNAKRVLSGRTVEKFWLKHRAALWPKHYPAK